MVATLPNALKLRRKRSATSSIRPLDGWSNKDVVRTAASSDSTVDISDKHSDTSSDSGLIGGKIPSASEATGARSTSTAKRYRAVARKQAGRTMTPQTAHRLSRETETRAISPAGYHGIQLPRMYRGGLSRPPPASRSEYDPQENTPVSLSAPPAATPGFRTHGD